MPLFFCVLFIYCTSFLFTQKKIHNRKATAIYARYTRNVAICGGILGCPPSRRAFQGGVCIVTNAAVNLPKKKQTLGYIASPPLSVPVRRRGSARFTHAQSFTTNARCTHPPAKPVTTTTKETCLEQQWLHIRTWNVAWLLLVDSYQHAESQQTHDSVRSKKLTVVRSLLPV